MRFLHLNENDINEHVPRCTPLRSDVVFIGNDNFSQIELDALFLQPGPRNQPQLRIIQPDVQLGEGVFKLGLGGGEYWEVRRHHIDYIPLSLALWTQVITLFDGLRLIGFFIGVLAQDGQNFSVVVVNSPTHRLVYVEYFKSAYFNIYY